MAKTTTKSKKTTSTKPETSSRAVATTSGEGKALMASLKNRIKSDAGKGLSSDQADNLIPLVYVLQAQSPQCLARNPKHIEGAEAGCLWLRNSADPIVDGEEGFEFQPCFFTKCWIEWKPNREGFVARHPNKPEDAKQVEEKIEGKKRLVWKNKAGNYLVESREHVGWVLGRGAPMGYVLPFSGSGHTVSKGWMTTMNQKQDEDGNVLPSWCYIYRIKTKFRSNDQGDWFTMDPVEERMINTEEEYMRGKMLHEQFASGAKVTGGYEADVDEAGEGEGDDSKI